MTQSHSDFTTPATQFAPEWQSFCPMRAASVGSRCFSSSSESAVARTAAGVRMCHDCNVTQTVLIVGAPPSFRASARAILEADGFSIVGEAEDGATGLALLRKLRPDVVL